MPRQPLAALGLGNKNAPSEFSGYFEIFRKFLELFGEFLKIFRAFIKNFSKDIRPNLGIFVSEPI